MEFLQTSTIHGLRYLSEVKGCLGRVIWLGLILTSFTLAIAISYANVVNWQNSPVTITKASTVMLKDENVPMPTITVCPQRPDYNAFVVNYVNKYYSRDKDPMLFEYLRGAVLLMRQKQTADQSEILNSVGSSDFKNACQSAEDGLEDTTESSDDPCSLVRLLHAINSNYMVYKDRNGTAERQCEVGVTKYEDLFKKYLFVVSVAKGIQPTNEGLARYLEEETGCTPKYWPSKTSPLPGMWITVGKVMSLYLTVFPRAVNVTWGGLGIHELKNLEDLSIGDIEEPAENDLQMLDEVYSSGKLGDLLGNIHLSDFSFLEQKAQEFVFGDIAKRLGLAEGPEAITDVAKLMNHFTYGEKMFSNGEPDDCVNVIKTPTCQDPDAKSRDYCSLIDKGVKNKDYINELLELTLSKINTHEKGLEQKSILPSCNWDGDKQQCWKRVHTDKGICFTSFKNENQTLDIEDPRHFTIVPTSLSNTFSFKGLLLGLKDPKSALWSNNGKEDTYEVMMTPRGRFALGKTANRLTSVASLPVNADNKILFNRVKVIPSLAIGGTDDFGSMSVSQRKCYYANEKELKHFGHYNQANCFLECAWELATETCQCVPWFLNNLYHDQPICEHFGNLCFKDVVDRRYKDSQGSHCYEGCLNDCETFEFEIEWERKGGLASPYVYCKEGFDVGYNGETSEEIESVCEIYSRRDKLARNRSVLRADPGHSNYKEEYEAVPFSIQHTRVYLGKVSTLKVLETSTMTTVDMISNIGGTLGLFCGFSVLSGIEIIYWAWKILGESRLAKKKLRGVRKNEAKVV